MYLPKIIAVVKKNLNSSALIGAQHHKQELLLQKMNKRYVQGKIKSSIKSKAMKLSF